MHHLSDSAFLNFTNTIILRKFGWSLTPNRYPDIRIIFQNNYVTPPAHTNTYTKVKITKLYPVYWSIINALSQFCIWPNLFLWIVASTWCYQQWPINNGRKKSFLFSRQVMIFFFQAFPNEFELVGWISERAKSPLQICLNQ